MIQRKQTLPIHGIINRDIAKTFMNVRISKNTQKIFFGNFFSLYFVLDYTFLRNYQETRESDNAFDQPIVAEKAILQCTYKLK